VGSQYHAPASLHLAKSPGIHDIAGWVGVAAGLDGECRRENLLPALVFEPWTIQFLMSYCIDCAVLVTLLPFYHAVIPSDITFFPPENFLEIMLQ
jgi:hypothetical protein